MDIHRYQFDQSSLDWSVVLHDARSGGALFEHGGDKVLRAASVGKLILLAFAGNELLRCPEDGEVHLDRRSVAPVADSGIWQHLSTDELPLADVVKLVFLASDNVATNVLLDHFGLERVRAFRSELGFIHTDLHDIVRDERGADDPGILSVACAGELCDVMARIAQDRLVNPELAGWLRRGLRLGMDLSMVPAPFGLDPLARPGGAGQAAVANKTGTDIGIRADTGTITSGSNTIAYAAICNYDAGTADDAAVLASMHHIGEAIRDML